MYFLPHATYSVGPKVSPMEIQEDPESALFRRLTNMRPREMLPIKPGRILVAVYGDNW